MPQEVEGVDTFRGWGGLEGLSCIRSKKQLTGSPQVAVSKVCDHGIDCDIRLLIFATYVDTEAQNRWCDKVKFNLI